MELRPAMPGAGPPEEIPKTALVVEPDMRNRERLRRALRRRGFEVIAAGSRAEASDLLDGQVADLVVMEEPGTSGSYRIVWLAKEDAADVTIEANRSGWKRFDRSSAPA